MKLFSLENPTSLDDAVLLKELDKEFNAVELKTAVGRLPRDLDTDHVLFRLV